MRFEKLIYNDINKEGTPVLVNFEYSREADDIEYFLAFDIEEDVVPADDEIQSIEFDLFIWNMFNYSVECTLHGEKGDYFIGDFVECMLNASDWLDQIPADVMEEIKKIFRKKDEEYEIPYDRLLALAKLFVDGLIQDGEGGAMEYFTETCEMTSEEMGCLGIKTEGNYD